MLSVSKLNSHSYQKKQCSSASHCFFSSVQLQLERTRMVIELYSSKLMIIFERGGVLPNPEEFVSTILKVIEPCHSKLKPSYVLLQVGVFPNPQETFLHLSLSLSIKVAPNSHLKAQVMCPWQTSPH